MQSNIMYKTMDFYTKIIKPLQINKPIEVAYPINSKNDITTILV